MIHYSTFQFASPPRTATTWFCQAAHIAGLGWGDKAHAHIPPPENYGGVNVCLVRHPYDWLVSYYYALLGGAIGVDCVDVFVPMARESKDLKQFVRRYTIEYPGAIWDMHRAYQASIVYRVEDLPWNVIGFFESLGVKKHLLKKLETAGPTNVCQNIPYVDFPKLKKRVCEVEKEFCERYDYDHWN